MNIFHLPLLRNSALWTPFDHQAMWEYQIGDYMARLDADMPMELEPATGEAELYF